MANRTPFSPFFLPIYAFGAVIVAGAALLHARPSLAGAPLSWLDALFTATSAVCVTGLVVVDTGSFFTRFGHGVILALIQVGGLGVMTFSTLAFYLWRRRVSLTDRLAVGQSLLHDPTFHLGRFLLFMVAWTLVIELSGALLLLLRDPAGFPPFSALFHSVSAFCNAGFGLRADNLVPWRLDLAVNATIMALIVLGGLGFSVVNDCGRHLMARVRNGGRGRTNGKPLSFHSRVVLRTSLFLIVCGAAVIFLAEHFARGNRAGLAESLLSGLFQSVTCRTAGFNTVDIGAMTNVSLLFMILLMFVGGSPGSTAGGVKTTTARTLFAFALSQMRGRPQTVVFNRALDQATLNKALTLFIFAMVTVVAATLALCVTEGGAAPGNTPRGEFLDLLFEVVSAFGTVGLSTGVTPTLSAPGKVVIILLMFLGRLGPILFLSALQSWQTTPRYAWPEESVMIG